MTRSEDAHYQRSMHYIDHAQNCTCIIAHGTEVLEVTNFAVESSSSFESSPKFINNYLQTKGLLFLKIGSAPRCLV